MKHEIGLAIGAPTISSGPAAMTDERLAEIKQRALAEYWDPPRASDWAQDALIHCVAEIERLRARHQALIEALKPKT